MATNPVQGVILKDLVLIGGGHSHVILLKNFGMKPLPGVRLTLIARDLHTPYSGMLPGYIAGHYRFDEAHIDLRPLCQFASARLYHDSAIRIDAENKRVVCANRPPVNYDLLSINIGSHPQIDTVPGAAEFATPIKPINCFIDRWQQILQRVRQQQDTYRIAVVGGGAAGVEILLAMQFRLQQVLRTCKHRHKLPEFHLVCQTASILPGFPSGVGQRFQRILKQRGIHLHLASRAIRVGDGWLRIARGDEIKSDEIIWVTNASAPDWLRASGLAVDQQGFMLANDTLQSTSHHHIFGAGDIVHIVNHPRPKSGVFAVRQGKPLSENLRCALLNQPLKPFKPQKASLALISTGDQSAIATWAGWHFEGSGLWRWKDWIDRRFTAKFNCLPDMLAAAKVAVDHRLGDQHSLAAASASAMRCGGCGAKISGGVLQRTITNLNPVSCDDILIGLHAIDDAAVLAIPPDKVLVQTVDYFPAFIDDPYRFGQIAANHCLSDIFAMGAAAHSALAIATLPFGIESKTEELLRQLMAGAMQVLNAANTALIGGHTSEGAELALGFSVNGLAEHDHILRKSSLQPGDSLILTKPLGTGTLLAADSQQKAKGRWIEAALASMLLSNREAAELFYQHGATACTDITGYGLLGHLLEMIRPATVNVEIRLSALPCLEGALQTVEMGILSSLQADNQRLQHSLKSLTRSHDPVYPLIFDPQTSGGLLASLPANQADGCLRKLQDAGYIHAAIIGQVTTESDAQQPVTLV